MSTLSALDALNRAAVSKRHPPVSSWWWETITRFVTSERRQLVARVGRRGGKSSTLCRLAVAFALAFDVKQIPPGDVGTIAFVSTTRDEATQRLRTIKALLDVIGVAYRPVDGGVELTTRPIVFKTFACTVQSVSGFTAILVLADEVAKWRDSDSGANPATEVLSALRPTMATQPDARIILSSSALGSEDAHAVAFALGDDDFQVTAFAETWVANPTITKDETHALERDLKVWAREYACIPQAGASSALDADEVRACLRKPRPGRALGQPVVLMDGAGGRGDSWVWAGGRYWQPEATVERATELDQNGFERAVLDADGKPKLIKYEATEPELFVGRIHAVTGKFSTHTTSDEIIDQIAADANAMGARHIVSDPYNAYPNASAFAKRGLALIVQNWTTESKAQGLARLRQWLRDKTLAIEATPNGEAMIKELIGLQETIRPSGSIGLGARRGHDDLAALVLNAAMLDIAGGFSGSPIQKSSRLYSGWDSLST